MEWLFARTLPSAFGQLSSYTNHHSHDAIFTADKTPQNRYVSITIAIMGHGSYCPPQRVGEEEEKQHRLLSAIDDALNAWPSSQGGGTDCTPSPQASHFKDTEECLSSQTERNVSGAGPDVPRATTPSPKPTAGSMASSVRGGRLSCPAIMSTSTVQPFRF